MRKISKLLIVLVLFSMMVPTAIFAGGSKSEAGITNLAFAVVEGAHYHFPVYVAREKGWFRDAGISLRELTFTNGPVMVEALARDGWDLGISGIGGILPAVITHNAVLLAPVNTDYGTQRLFVRANSPLLATGRGHNSLDSRIYGTADAWRGLRVICNTGAVLQFFLNKVLTGFNLTGSDVQLLAMDVATAGSAFRAGEGDMVAMTGSSGVMAMLADRNFVSVAEGPWVETGLMGICYAPRSAVNDPVKRAAMVTYFRVYHETLAWIERNKQEAIGMMVDFGDEVGNTMDRRSAEIYLGLDRFYTIQEAVDMMTTRPPGKNHSIMEEDTISVLNFFIDFGSRQRGDAERFAGNVDPSLMQELLRR